MSENKETLNDNTIDDGADRMIADCVTADPPISFFLFAGAGSGKTLSLTKALQEIKKTVGARFQLNDRRVGVITYTKKARDEIKHRLEYDNLFAVSTIHHFAWSMIKGFDHDIREWLKINLQTEIELLEEKEAKGHAGTKASIDRLNAMSTKNERLQSLYQIKQFIYNPDSENPERNALNHSEVIKITASFITKRAMMQNLLVNRFPILLVDESQDTDKELMDALFSVQVNQKKRFCLGVIGDTMQRIYMTGKLDLGSNLPDDWAKPEKRMNHRSCHGVIKLVNKIREPVDGQEQQPRSDKDCGFVRLFIIPAGIADKPAQEQKVYTRMADITSDDGWLEPNKNVKTLILEHHMAAARFSFLPLWDTLNSVSSLQTGLRDGSLPGLRFFSHLILPLIKAHQDGDRFAVASIARKHSQFLQKKTILKNNDNQSEQIKKAKKAVNSLADLWSKRNTPSFLHVLKSVSETNLFEIPEILRPYVMNTEEATVEDEEDDKKDELFAWRKFLDTSFDQIERYSPYIQGGAQYDTHQGIKGLEFPRVCVIMDDSEARGFTFSYEKLFGAKEDSTNREPGKETSIDRTRRLFYVTCSRAEDSLALVAYTSEPIIVHENVVGEGWFTEEEIVHFAES